MTFHPSSEIGSSRQLSDGWTMCLTSAGEWKKPSDKTAISINVPAIVPGTVAAALERAGQFQRDQSLDLDQKDAWYSRVLNEPAGNATLHFEGLATYTEIYLNDMLVLSTDSMFQPYSVDIELTGEDRLDLCFRALGPILSGKQPRARWRPQMIVPPAIRMIRTTLLGRMPGWCPEIHAVGPYRPIILQRKSAGLFYDVNIASSLDAGGTGQLIATVRSQRSLSGYEVHCASSSALLTELETGVWTAKLSLPNVKCWWPQTHGEPVLHHIDLVSPSGDAIAMGRTGFRHVEIDRGLDGSDFALKINGVTVFCRGAVWTNADIVSLPGDRCDYEPWLKLAAQAGFNMIRIGGTMTYETTAFFELCDELGLMVWQDAMLANFDYPASDVNFVTKIETEVRAFLSRTAASPSLVVFCGGSEMYQQAAMLGLPGSMWAGPITEQILPSIVSSVAAQLAYVPNSPSGGAMPFSPNSGVTHYYGVGAYCRPLDDARRANVRFSAESLAFANVPEQVTLDKHLPVQPVHDPRWKARVPRDRGASWDFEDIRDHYLNLLYGFEPNQLRREDPDLYLALSRAVTVEVLEATYAEWRRDGSTCHGALVFTLQDLLPGPGWGVIDSTGLPKPIWHAMRRAFRPVQVLLTDEGTNGLDVHVLNEQAAPLDVTVELICLRDGHVPVVRGQKELTIDARTVLKRSATDVFGAFFDTTYAFRFGPPSHTVTVASLKDRNGNILATAFHFPQGRQKAFGHPKVEGVLSQDDTGWFLSLKTEQLAQSVNIVCSGYLPSDNWFHLMPGLDYCVRLNPTGEADAQPEGEVFWLGAKSTVRF